MQILFLGAPGAGKGTQCQKLAEKLAIPHLSSGDLLREAVKQGTDAGKRAKEYMDRGDLVPDEVLIAMFRERLTSDEMRRGFILDGFPRNLAQARSLDELLVEINRTLSIVINLSTSDELLEERIVGRRVCPNKSCNAVYHVKFKPPAKEGICDLCQTELNHRSDDKPEVVKQRLKNYRELTEPLIKYYDEKGLLETINGEGAPQEVYEHLLERLKVACS